MSTTFALIRNHFAGTSSARGLIEALTPTLNAAHAFKRSRRRNALRDWAVGGSNCLRHFEFVTNGDEQDTSEAYGQDSRTVVRPALITIAYPALPLIGGQDEMDSLADLIESDATQIRDCLFSPSSYIADLYHVFPTIRAPERGAEVWFQEIDVLLQFRKAQTL